MVAELAARGIKPWEIGRLSVPEWLAFVSDIKQERWNARG
jgi:hypothetical protein